MARIAGRNLWIAVPAGALCVGVVGALTYLAVPALPLAAAWVGDQAYNATHMAPPVAVEGTASRFAQADTSDCRSLYPDRLWSELVWTPGVLLSQTTASPPPDDTGLAEALAPEVRVTCTWNGPGDAAISTSVAAVGGDAAGIAQTALVGAGFTCTTSAGLECTRSRGVVVEEHVLRDGLWISSVETSWHPADYSARIVSRLWP